MTGWIIGIGLFAIVLIACRWQGTRGALQSTPAHEQPLEGFVRDALHEHAERLYPDGPDSAPWPGQCATPPCSAWDNRGDRAGHVPCDNHKPQGKHHAPPLHYGPPPIVADSRGRTRCDGCNDPIHQRPLDDQPVQVIQAVALSLRDRKQQP